MSLGLERESSGSFYGLSDRKSASEREREREKGLGQQSETARGDQMSGA